MPSKRPYNFSWILEGILAGSGYPSERSHFEFYAEQNIKHVVSLTEWKPPLKLVPGGINLVFMPVEEFEAPSIKQLDEFTKMVHSSEKKKEGVVVHCHWGRGRTGTMMAAYLIKHRNMSPWDAITHVRSKRPHSIETYDQEDVLFDFAELLSTKEMYRKKMKGDDWELSSGCDSVAEERSCENSEVDCDIKGKAAETCTYEEVIHCGDSFS